MEAIVTTFVAAAMAEWGDKTQLVVAFLAARSLRPAIVLAGFLAAAIVSNAVAAWAGDLVARTITVQAMTLLVALALLFAGVAGLIRRSEPPLGSTRTPLLIAAFLLTLAAEMGDRTQFLTFALSGRFGFPGLSAAGATAGMLAACIPAALMGDRIQTLVPMRAMRLVGAFLFILVGFLTAVSALGLT